MASDTADYRGCPVTVTEAVGAGVALRPVRWGIGDVLVMLAISAVSAAGGTAALHALDAPFALIVIVGGLLGWVGLAGWPLYATWRRGNGPRIDLGLRLTWGDVRAGVIGGLVSLAAAAVVTMLLIRLLGAFNSTAGEAASRLVDEGDRPAVIVFALMIMIGAPIAEELGFRGLLFGAVRKRGVGVWWTVVISAVVFSLFHLEPTRIPLLLVVGLGLGVVRARTGSTGASIIAHMVVNGPGSLFLLLGIPGVTP